MSDAEAGSRPSDGPTFSIVVAWDAPRRQRDAWERFAAGFAERYPRGELVLVYREGDPPGLGARAVAERAVPTDALTPHQWAAGFGAASAETVAVTTTHFVPDFDWADAVARLCWPDDVAAIGGTIVVADGSRGLDWAIWIQRYARFAPPVDPLRDVDDVAADDAVYRRSLVVAHDDLLAEGFWEPNFHRRFAAAGLVLRLSDELRLTFGNEYGAAAFCRMRVAHGREFGYRRASAMSGARRLAYGLATPLVPAVLGAKLLARVRPLGLGAGVLVRALPWLALFLCAWALGEARGAWRAARGAPAP